MYLFMLRMNYPYYFGGTGQILTGGFKVLQTFALGHSATVPKYGAPARIRTADLPLTRRLLWPTELLGRYLAYPQGFEPRPAVLETVMLPLTPRVQKSIYNMVLPEGFEPPT